VDLLGYSKKDWNDSRLMPGRVGCLAASGSPSFEGRKGHHASEKMHSDALDIDAALVARLIAAQFPQWADLPVVKAPSAGTDHAIYRLADDMVGACRASRGRPTRST
jgi:hypothetical protein